MKTVISKTSLFTTYEIAASAQEWVLPVSVLLYASTGPAISETSDHADNAITVLGRAVSADSEGVYSQAASSSILVGSRGVVIGLTAGIHTTGPSQSVTNLGTIDGRTVGIQGDGEAFRIDNSGSVGGETSILFGEHGGQIVNRATGIISGLTAIKTATADLENAKTVNFGTIEGTTAYEAAGTGCDIIVNHGTIRGAVFLGDGDDIYNGLDGTVSGNVTGGAGSDVYWIGRHTFKIVEGKALAGQDVVKSAVSYTLGAGLEQLTLLGNGALEGSGNGGSNTLYGNAGANILNGGAGIDVLSGGAGNDTLTGGKDSDTFQFSTGCGKDVVTDYRALSDIIDLSGMDGITRYNVMLDHATTVDGNLVIIDGDDQITLIGVSSADLSKDHFTF